MDVFDKYMIGLVIFITSMFISRQIATNGLKKLDADRKAKLVDLFSSNKLWQYLFIVVPVLGFYAAVRFTELNSQLVFVIYMLVILGYVIFNSIVAYMKLRSNSFPDDYIKSYLTSSTVRLIGIFLFFGLILAEF